MKRMLMLFSLVGLGLVIAFAVYASEEATWGKIKAGVENEGVEPLRKRGGKKPATFDIVLEWNNSSGGSETVSRFDAVATSNETQLAAEGGNTTFTLNGPMEDGDCTLPADTYEGYVYVHSGEDWMNAGIFAPKHFSILLQTLMGGDWRRPSNWLPAEKNEFVIVKSDDEHLPQPPIVKFSYTEGRGKNKIECFGEVNQPWTVTITRTSEPE